MNRVLSIGRRVNIPSPISTVVKEVKLAARVTGDKVSVLDIGYGLGNHWAAFSQKLLGPDLRVVITALDAVSPPFFPPVIDGSGSEPSVEGYIQGEAPMDLATIPSQSFDLVIGFDLIEHLSKENGYLLLYEMERISKHSAVIFTPNGHVWQPPSAENPMQAHISGWTPSELRAFGWNRIRGATGLKFMFGPYAKLRGKSDSWSRIVSVVFSRIVLLFPNLAFSFVAIHRKNTASGG